MQTNSFPRTLFVLKYRDNIHSGPYTGPFDSPTNVPLAIQGSDWGDGDGKTPLSSGLYNSARFVKNMLEQAGVPVELVHVPDNNKIHRALYDFKADVVVIEAFWVVPDKFDELTRVCPNVKFVIRNHSETPFLANEGIAFDWMLKYVRKPNVIMSCNAPRMLEEARFLVKLENPTWTEEEVKAKVVLLPNYYPVDEEPKVGYIDKESPFVNVGCFGAVRPLKNHLLQAIAALKFATSINKRLRFHINSGRIEMNGGPILHNLIRLFNHYPQHELVHHRWFPHGKFKDMVSTMDLVAQVSFSETFNIVAADAITSGVATVTSSEVKWASSAFVADPTQCNHIEQVMHKAYITKLQVPKFNPSLHGLQMYNRESMADWLSFLSRFSK
jgi:hypothetical protein